MGYSCRKFIVHDDGTLDRMRNNVFDRLLRDPQHHSMPAMAGRRVRVADIVVQLENRRPYMDAPGLPSFQFMTAGREDCTRTSGLWLRHGRCP